MPRTKCVESKRIFYLNYCKSGIRCINMKTFSVLTNEFVFTQLGVRILHRPPPPLLLDFHNPSYKFWRKGDTGFPFLPLLSRRFIINWSPRVITHKPSISVIRVMNAYGVLFQNTKYFRIRLTFIKMTCL